MGNDRWIERRPIKVESNDPETTRSDRSDQRSQESLIRKRIIYTKKEEYKAEFQIINKADEKSGGDTSHG